MKVLIVGAGLGGLRTAEALRSNGFSGEIVIVGDESHQPYNRPPLSKEALNSGLSHEDLKFRQRDSVADVSWVLGCAAVKLDLAEHKVILADGTSCTFDALVVSTGIRPRLLPIPGPTQGLFTLRTLNDAQSLQAAIGPGVNVVILGSGFIGCELAATATTLGANVHVVSLDIEPMVMPMGVDLGAAMRKRHETKGVTFHLGHTVEKFNGDHHIESVTLDSGEVITASVVIEAIGSVPNTQWLHDNGLNLDDGVLVDSNMRALGAQIPIYAVGDISNHPNKFYGNQTRRIEHWNMPTETGKRAGAALAAELAGRDLPADEFFALPAFWSDQYEFQLQSYGLPGAGTSHRVASGALDGACIIEYFDEAGALCGVIGIDTVKELMPYRTQFMAAKSWESSK
ncbi:MAG: FAD-dependent oxidoreductase [Candidatus Nanopelagicales bacterium]|jgi:3-phenylpropionate/trans-cinnamate dioxygenase ferredoxin reductase subunit